MSPFYLIIGCANKQQLAIFFFFLRAFCSCCLVKSLFTCGPTLIKSQYFILLLSNHLAAVQFRLVRAGRDSLLTLRFTLEFLGERLDTPSMPCFLPPSPVLTWSWSERLVVSGTSCVLKDQTVVGSTRVCDSEEWGRGRVGGGRQGA